MSGSLFMADNESMLYQKYDIIKNMGMLDITIPKLITDNINHTLRAYQEDGLKRYLHYFKHYPQRNDNNHLLFEMATGTGKTLIMACLMLNLYKQGFRNFIFFVNSTNILEKTKQNFTQSATSKYLFSKKIIIDDENIEIKAIDSLEDSNNNCINILFTTIQSLHLQIQNPKENGFCLEDFKHFKVILLADEAHHNSTNTKTDKDLFTSWEDSVLSILSQNSDNQLLEFSATAQLDKPALKEKYKDKVLISYNLKQFRQDKYSKNIFLAQTKTDDIKERFLLAILLSQYRLEIASKYSLNLKPIVLFKSRTIKQSENNTKLFNEFIENIDESIIEEIFSIIAKYRDIEIYKNVYEFFSRSEFSYKYIADRLKIAYSKDKILNVNNDKEVTNLQIKLNTLEDYQNKYRVIFAVDKLNEGWDVLNLYDIVKLYETPSTQGKPPTAKEIQLIGRGARLYPFILSDEQDKYKRKFDSSHEAIVLEQLHFHTPDGSAYIEHLNKELEYAGLIDRSLIEIEMKLKNKFKDSSIYKNGKMFVNTRAKRNKESIFEINLFGKINLDEKFSDLMGSYKVKIDLDNFELGDSNIADFKYTKNLNLKLDDIPTAIFLKAIAKNKHFRFDKIAHKLGLESIIDIKNIFSNNTLSILYPKEFDEKDVRVAKNLIKVCNDFLTKLGNLVNDIYTEYKGSTKLEAKAIKDVFKNKKITINKDEKNKLLLGKEFKYFAQNKLKGNEYEKELVGDICNYFEHNKFETNWLIRNEKHFRIYNFDDGKAYEPDFLLMVDNKNIIYHIFVEPKGEHLVLVDKWKENLVKKFADNNFKGIEIYSDKYKIVAMPFYQPKKKNIFLDNLSIQLSSKN